MSAILGLQQPDFPPARSQKRAELIAVPRQRSFLAELIERAEEHKTELPPMERLPVPVERKSYPMPLGARLAMRAMEWVKKSRSFSAGKQLRVSDTVSLGEKRFVAVVHVEGKKFLIGGGTAGVSLLTQLTGADAGNEMPDAAEQAE